MTWNLPAAGLSFPATLPKVSEGPWLLGKTPSMGTRIAFFSPCTGGELGSGCWSYSIALIRPKSNFFLVVKPDENACSSSCCPTWAILIFALRCLSTSEIEWLFSLSPPGPHICYRYFQLVPSVRYWEQFGVPSRRLAGAMGDR